MSEFIKDLKDIFFGDSQLLKDLGIKRGFVAGLKYWCFILFTLPIKILKVIANLDYKLVFFVEKVNIALLSIFKNFKNISNMAEVYSAFVSAVNKNADNVVMPNLASIEGFVNEYRLIKLANVYLLFFLSVIFVVFCAEDIGLLASTISASASAGATMSLLQGQHTFFMGLTAGAFTQIVAFIVIFLAILIWFGYLFYGLTKMFIINLKSFICVNKDDLAEFVINTLDYTYIKTTEIYGKKVAKKALFMLLENYVTNKDYAVNTKNIVSLKNEYKLLQNKENEKGQK